MANLNINSEAWCRKAYLNYHCYNNSMGLSTRDMAKITQAWESRISSWQNTVSNDENEYDFDDSDYSMYKEKGKETAKDATGYSGNDTGNIINGSTSALTGIGGAGWNVTTGGIGALKNFKGNLWSPGSKSLKYTQTCSVEGDTLVVTGKKNKVKASTYVQAALAIATAAAYRIKKPNKTEKEACDEMQNVLNNAQGTLSETQGEMAAMSEELIALSDEANETNEQANEEMLDKKTEYDMYMRSLMSIQAKIESGQPLSSEEKAFYQELVKILGELGINIGETSEETTDVVQEIYGDMETYQEGYDYAAETMAEVEGITDYAASFDEATRTMCYVQGVSQGLNAASGAMAGAKLMGMGFWNWALGVASIAAGVSSLAAAAEQVDMAKQVGYEIDVRKGTQELNTATNEIYTEEIDTYDGLMTGVEELEMEVPKDVEAPEAVPLSSSGEPAGNTSGSFGSLTGGSGTGSEDPKKKQEK